MTNREMHPDIHIGNDACAQCSDKSVIYAVKRDSNGRSAEAGKEQGICPRDTIVRRTQADGNIELGFCQGTLIALKTAEEHGLLTNSAHAVCV
jgi:hypothetical protein